MQFNKSNSTDNSSTLSSTLSTNTNIDSVITREKETSEVEVIYSCEQKIGSRSGLKPSYKSVGFMSRMVYASSVKIKI